MNQCVENTAGETETQSRDGIRDEASSAVAPHESGNTTTATSKTAASNNTAVEVHDIDFSYGPHPVLRGVNLSIETGTVVCLTGDNGSGKSTLLKLMIGELTPQRGQVRVFGHAAGTRAALENIGYLPQMNVVNKVSFPITSREIIVQGLARDFGFIKIPRRGHYRIVEDALEKMGLAAYRDTPFGELSGGFQQRVLIARALIHQPKMLFLDEPTVGVDKKALPEILQLLDRLRQDSGLTIVLVTHELDTVRDYLHPDRIYRLDEGRLQDA